MANRQELRKAGLKVTLPRLKYTVARPISSPVSSNSLYMSSALR